MVSKKVGPPIFLGGPTCYQIVELPGIEAAYNAPELHRRETSQHGVTWENMTENENVLTTVSTPKRRVGPDALLSITNWYHRWWSALMSIRFGTRKYAA